jgi:hypothetical protein
MRANVLHVHLHGTSEDISMYAQLNNNPSTSRGRDRISIVWRYSGIETGLRDPLLKSHELLRRSRTQVREMMSSVACWYGYLCGWRRNKKRMKCVDG